MMQGLNPNGKLQMVKVDADGKLVVTGVAGGGGGSGTSDTTEATQLLVKAAVESINTKTPALSAGKVPVTDPTALPLPAGAATAALQGAANASLANIDSSLGTPSDAAATGNAGTFSLVALVKRALENWTTLLARIPALVSGRIPVDASGAIQLGTGAVTATTQRVTLAADGPGVANLSSIDGKLPASLGGKAGAASLSVTTATGIITSIGGTVAAGGTAQQLAAANTARRGLTLQNTSPAELRVSPFGVASATAGYRVSAGELLVLDAPHCGVGAVSIWGATTGQTFVGGEAV